MTLGTPNPQKVSINGQDYDYLAFYYPGENTDWDNLYSVPYFGNFWEKHPFTVKLKTATTGNFHTAEAAYQASKWWNDASMLKQFESKTTGDEAFKLKRKNERQGLPQEPTYGGYNTGEEAMYAILLQKFSDKIPDLKAALGATGNAYLLEHSALLSNPDYTWSDGNDGNGKNHLGIILMKVRAHYFPGQDNPMAHLDSKKVIMACTTALRAEMSKRGLSAENLTATQK